jgi:hypothetical protein
MASGNGVKKTTAREFQASAEMQFRPSLFRAVMRYWLAAYAAQQP